MNTITKNSVIELRASVRNLQSAGSIPSAAWQSLGNPRVGTFIASASREECEYLINSALPGWSPATVAAPVTVTASAALAEYGPLGSALAAEVERASAAGIRAVAQAADSEAEAALARILAKLPTGPERVPMALAAVKVDAGSPHNLRMLAKFCSPGASKKPVKFAGEPGASKTYAARAFGAAFFNDSTYDIGCHAGTTQREFLGAYVPYGAGFEKVYGRIARAFKAAMERPTLLIVDEINRLPVELSSVFCSALNRQLRDGVEHYVLDTGLPDGKGGTEEIAAPCHNLSVVATCNEGAGYNTSPDDRAELQRWVHLRCEFSADLVRTVARQNIIRRWGAVTPEATVNTIADAFANFVQSARDLALVHHRLASAPTIRCVADAVTLADDPADVIPTLLTLCEGWHCAINRMSGATEPEHKIALRECVMAAGFPAPFAIAK
jgi:MoxR-like ATPase